MAGFNLPPGVNVSDIPGNRPEDEEWDNVIEAIFASGLSPEEVRIKLGLLSMVRCPRCHSMTRGHREGSTEFCTTCGGPLLSH